MFFGDSICYGHFVSPHCTWVTSISYKLHETFGEKLWVNNCSVSGNTTRMALERMYFDVLAHHVDIILIQFGLNDCMLWETDRGLPRVSKKSFQANLEEIIQRSKLFGAQQIFLTTNHPVNKFIKIGNNSIPHQKGNFEYNKIIRKVAKSSTNVQLIDIEKIFLSYPLKKEKLLQPDGVHLSKEGHSLYFCHVYPYMKQAVKVFIGEIE